MNLNLEGKCIFVTGATQGLGAEIAREAARRGAASIGVCGLNSEKGNAIVTELNALGSEARHFDVDLAEQGAPERLFGEMLAWKARVDGLVNCAGITDRASFLDGTNENWERLFAVNARAPFFLMQAFIRENCAAKRNGSIVNITSINAHCGSPELAIYSASKGALATLTRNAANAHLSDKIRVNAINMGWSPTEAEQDMQSRILGKGDDWLSAAEGTAPLGRLLHPIEVARLCIYLLSDYSGLQTGTITDLEQRVIGAP